MSRRLLPLFAMPAMLAAASLHIASPDGNIEAAFHLADGGVPVYSIRYQRQPLVLESRLGFPELRDGFSIMRSSRTRHRGQWTNPLGERRIVPDSYRELNVDLRHPSGIQMRLTFRAYNEGAAFRYTFPETGRSSTLRFSGEISEFRFPPDTYAYEEHGTEGEYRRVAVADIQPQCERPLTLEYPGGRFAALTEAANSGYSRTLLSPLAGVRGALVTALGGATSNGLKGGHDDGNVVLRAGDSTPWRVLVAGTTPGGLLERNYLLLNLNPPSAIRDTSWIQPGKAMRDITLTTADANSIVDFAAKPGLRFVGFDARWYGSEDASLGDATAARAPNLDLAAVIRHATEKGIAVSLYVDRRQLMKQRDTLFPLYEKWGVKAVKLGFVDVGSQADTAYITETIRKAAEHHLMLNIHDGYRATGNNRTWPNLLTVEGIRGNEHRPSPEHNTTLPFTRYINGIGDYTICYYTRNKTTSAHQLAMSVVSFSPMQWILWYDKPSDYKGEPEMEFFARLPTVWDETRVVHGRIGEYASISRRQGDQWFIGTINNSRARTLDLPLGFLQPRRKYRAHIYSDDPASTTATKVSATVRDVDSRTSLRVDLQAAGGQAIWIEPLR